MSEGGQEALCGDHQPGRGIEEELARLRSRTVSRSTPEVSDAHAEIPDFWLAVALTIGLIVDACQSIRGPALVSSDIGPRVTGYESGPTAQDVIEAMDRKGFVSQAGAAEPPE